MKLSRWIVAAVLPFAAACEAITGLMTDPDAPAHLSYQLIPSGNPDAPLGVLLSWDIPSSGRANAFNVYARSSGSNWVLRATTTSPTFHDAGVPESQYYVATRDANGGEIAQSNVVTVDLQSRLPAPQGLGSISLDRAVQLYWSSNAVSASSTTFDHYLVYSTPYDASRGVCTASWVLEGSTVADGFLSGNLTNGVSRCYVVSAVTHDGHESQWSEARLDTPRPDGRNVVVYSRAARPDSAALLFYDEVAKVPGRVGSAQRADADVTIERHADGSLWFAPARTAVTMALYSTTPVASLTSIDRAPSSGFAAVSIEATPGYAYVFRLQKADGVHYAAARVAYVTPNYVVLDWSYQPSVGNVELSIAP